MIDWDKSDQYNESVAVSGAQLTKLTSLWQTVYGVSPLDGMCGPVTKKSIDEASITDVVPVQGTLSVVQMTDKSFVVRVVDEGVIV